jgi:hypothetical protein
MPDIKPSEGQQNRNLERNFYKEGRRHTKEQEREKEKKKSKERGMR